MSKKSIFEHLAESYERNPGARLVTGLIPVAPAIEGLLLAHAKNLEVRRVTEFFRQLKNEDFVHKCLITARAAARTRRNEKIRHFAVLLANGTFRNLSSDAYEESLQIVDELSYREFLALQILEGFEAQCPIEEVENNLQRATKFWKEFIDQIHSSVGIAPEIFVAFMKRIERTGCYAEIPGYYDNSGGVGYTTERYQEIKLLCTSKSQTRAD
jgi:hypothetical protein